jgi:hypothetical protein
MARLRPDLPPLPPRIARLPVDDRGYPVPWFVSWIDGKPEFRAADGRKFDRALKEHLCWVCGGSLSPLKQAFVIGPMCSVNRVSAEPPSHEDCALFSVRACPFLTKPHMTRRENDLPPGGTCAGEMIARNPGVSCVWRTRWFQTFADGNRGLLFRIGDPEPGGVTWHAEGRTATRAEVLASVESGLPILMDMARKGGADSVAELGRMTEAAKQYLPAA